jgi:hypothetical protein
MASGTGFVIPGISLYVRGKDHTGNNSIVKTVADPSNWSQRTPFLFLLGAGDIENTASSIVASNPVYKAVDLQRVDQMRYNIFQLLANRAESFLMN